MPSTSSSLPLLPPLPLPSGSSGAESVCVRGGLDSPPAPAGSSSLFRCECVLHSPGQDGCQWGESERGGHWKLAGKGGGGDTERAEVVMVTLLAPPSHSLGRQFSSPWSLVGRTSSQQQTPRQWREQRIGIYFLSLLFTLTPSPAPPPCRKELTTRLHSALASHAAQLNFPPSLLHTLTSLPHLSPPSPGN